MLGNPERFEAPRWLARRGYRFVIEAEHYQAAPIAGFFPGFIAVEAEGLHFVLDRASGNHKFAGWVNGLHAQVAHEWSVLRSEIRSIEVAVPSVPLFLTSREHLRISTSTDRVEWFSTSRCTVWEAANVLSSMVFGAEPRS